MFSRKSVFTNYKIFTKSFSRGFRILEVQNEAETLDSSLFLGRWNSNKNSGYKELFREKLIFIPIDSITFAKHNKKSSCLATLCPWSFVPLWEEGLKFQISAYFYNFNEGIEALGGEGKLPYARSHLL